MKDLFIDNSCVVKNFANPADEEYKALIKWLLDYEEDSLNNAHLVVSNKLLNEYNRSSGGGSSMQNITTIVAILQRQGRLNKIENKDIKAFIKKHFTNKIKKKLRSNAADHPHIATILLSERKLALTEDVGLWNDLLNFPGYEVQVHNRPEKLPYR